MVKIEKEAILTLEDGYDYFVADIIEYKDKTYYYLMSPQEKGNLLMFATLENQGGEQSLEVVENKNLLASLMKIVATKFKDAYKKKKLSKQGK